MTTGMRIESALEGAVRRAESGAPPPKLAAAIRYAVFPGGARVRPRLCLAVADACGAGNSAVADGAAAAIELLHCASLTHDDLPCFDNADTRRGKPSVHAAFGETLGVLTGDALIIMAFETLTLACACAPELLAPLLKYTTRGVGMPSGIVAGQAWESETRPPVDCYQRAKTSALFVAAAMSGAAAAGADPLQWVTLGEKFGEAYQVADDLLDAVGDEKAGKPTGVDALLQRPSQVIQLGLEGAYAHMQALVSEAIAAIPACSGASTLSELVRGHAMRLAPKLLARNAA